MSLAPVGRRGLHAAAKPPAPAEVRNRRRGEPLETGPIRVDADSSIDGCRLATAGLAQIIIERSRLVGVVLDITDSVAAQFIDAEVDGPDDWFTLRPAGDPFLWTAHRTANGWRVHAGCVRNVDLTREWDATSTPDKPTPELIAARQAAYATAQARIGV